MMKPKAILVLLVAGLWAGAAAPRSPGLKFLALVAGRDIHFL